MNASLFLNNLAVYSLQVSLLVGIAAFIPAALRLRQPGGRLVFWQILLAVCLTFPAFAPKKQSVAGGTVEVTTTITAIAAPGTPASRPLPSPADCALALLAAGLAARLGWLGIGFLRLRRYRLRSRPLEPAPAWSVEADLRLSDDVASPVTFGLRRPVVLLPASFPQLAARLQEAILAHECLHVRRRDWLFTLVEELVRAALWFHPAVWWLLGEIQLSREQTVDQAAVEMTKGREEYLDALLAIAGAKPRLDLAPAPLFLRKRHLKQRVVSILKEVPMSKKRIVAALAAGCCILAAACWMVSGVFPLSAAPQVVADAPGVTVDVGSAALMHRSPVPYPAAALSKGIEGTVVVQATLDAAGNVTDARVVTGPEELRRGALQSVLQWHFAREAGAGPRQVSISFHAPPQATPAQLGTVQTRVEVRGGGGPAPGAGAGAGGSQGNRAQAAAEFDSLGLKVTGIEVTGLSDQARDQLLSSLPVREGDAATVESMRSLSAAVKQFDEHLSLSMRRLTSATGSPGMQIRIVGPNALQSASGSPIPPPQPGGQRIKVGGNVQAASLIRKVSPVYPPEAKQARIQGHVILDAVIGPDGTIMGLTPSSGHPLLVESAMEAVKQWVYKPTLLNGQPVEVQTQIDVNYTLSDAPPPQQ